MNKGKVIIGTRGSKLALWQANWVKSTLVQKSPGLVVELQIVKTEGDARHDLSPGAFGREGIFTAELDRALLEKSADLAVHSLKDLPTRLAPGLALSGVTERETVTDLLIINKDAAAQGQGDGLDLVESLQSGLTIGTSSLRRVAQLKNRFPRLGFAPMRGNLDTRLRKLADREVDAIVVAMAGLVRLGLDTGLHLVVPLLPDWYLPAAGQGALALETRADDPAVEVAMLLDHADSRAAVTAERTAMSALGAGCRVPAGFLGRVDRGSVTVKGVVAQTDGEPLIRAEAIGPSSDAESVGSKLADKLLALGAAEILKEARE